MLPVGESQWGLEKAEYNSQSTAAINKHVATHSVSKRVALLLIALF